MHDIKDLIAGLKQNISILTAFIDSIPQEALDIIRRQGFWSIAEHISHLAEVQPMVLERLQRFRSEDHPVFTPYIPGEEEVTSDSPQPLEVAKAVEQFERVRREQVALLESAGQDLWQKTADHPEYHRYGFYILARHILMHDHWHMYRMEELWLTRGDYLTDLS